MRIEVIAIAEEILKGMIINTNSSYISATLSRLGWSSSRHTVLPDEKEALTEGLKEALARSDLVITTGGLGPTLDDITRHVAAELFSSDFTFNKEIAEDLAKRYGKDLPSLADQATVPTKAHILKNAVGTAPGFVFTDKGKTLVLMPGVPPEMQPMLDQEVIPYLKKNFSNNLKPLVETIHFCLINENMLDPLLRQLKNDYPSMEFGIYPGYGVLTVTLKSGNTIDLKAARDRIVSEFPTHQFTGSSGKIEEALSTLLKEQKKTLSFAESCTGGLMAHKITSLPGASDFFLGSLVTYSNQMKEQVLKVAKTTLESCGAVSKETVEEMLHGLLEVSQADYGIAVSGIAGPSGGTQDKPVGTVWAAIGERGKKPDLFRLDIRGSRQTIILISSIKLLASLYRKIRYGVSPQEVS
ncbi:MAG: CinA family nicotinamide mononucleotide deamidase-related protein [Chlamydiae bacterium]|nr:CinA family nicotinamide mononucleotide deamidase-related protein [Chlamydiota bacterium]